jgi:LytS/YehU family sensor histidine kinase
MHPHFFYTALNTIQSFILSNNKKQAVNYLSKFSSLTRTTLEMNEKESISIADQEKTLSLYLDIEQGRFEDDFSYKIQIDDAIDKETIKIPTMLLQPYVENAVKHGLMHKQGSKKISIHFQKDGEYIRISIDDNGIGRQKSAELNAIKNKNRTSFAARALEHKVDLLNQYNHENISIQYLDKTNLSNQAVGTTIVFEIPISF